MKKFVLCAAFILLSLTSLLAQFRAIPLKEGGNGFIISNDSLMLFQGQSLYLKPRGEQVWHKIDSLLDYYTSYCLNKNSIYRKKVNTTYAPPPLYTPIYNTEITVSHDKGASWELVAAVGKMGNRPYENVFVVSDNSIFLRSREGDIFEYKRNADTLIKVLTATYIPSIAANSLFLKNQDLYFSSRDRIFKLDSIEKFHAIATIPGYAYNFEMDGNKLAVQGYSRAYFSIDSGVTWSVDSLPQDTANNVSYWNSVKLHNNLFYLITNYQNYADLVKIRSAVAYSADGVNWVRDSLLFSATINHAGLNNMGFSGDTLFIGNANGVLQYDKLQRSFIPGNHGIAENRIVALATNSTYHLIFDMLSLTLKNRQTGVESDIGSFLPTDRNWDAYQLSLTETNKIYFGVMDQNIGSALEKLYVSHDLGLTWSLVNSYVIDFFATNDSLFYITDKKYFRSFDAGLTSTQVFYGNPYYNPIRFASEDKDDYSIRGSHNILYASSVPQSHNGRYWPTFRSADFGLTWQFQYSTQNQNASLAIGQQYDYAIEHQAAAFSIRNAADSTWSPLNKLGLSLYPYRNYALFHGIFLWKNSLYLFESNGIYGKNYPNGKVRLFVADNGYRSFYPIFESSHLDKLALKFHAENDIICLIPQINSPYYYCFNDSGISNIGFASGKVLYDANHNGITDSLDTPMGGIVISNGKTSAISSSNGNYLMPLAQINDTISAYTGQNYASVSPVYRIVNAGDTGIDFLVIQPNVTDLSINATLVNPPRRGFKNTLFLNIKNEGSSTSAYDIKLVKDHLTFFKSAVPSPNAVNGDTLIWNCSSISPAGYFTIKIIDSVSVNDQLSRSLHYVATLFTAQSDTLLSNNIDSIQTIIVGAYDPNDKAVEPKIYTDSNKLADDFLTYTIRFQNTGNAYASYVRIDDTLSPLLDITTLQTVAASHSFNVDFRAGNVISYWFPGISLPYSGVNEPGSHGYVTFKIKPKATWMKQQTITNTAQIYFDFNLPLTTNTVSSEITNPTFSTLNASVCDSFLLNGITYYATGSYTQTLVNAAGFDSIITLNLLVNAYQKIINQAACETFAFNNLVYDSSGVYQHVFTNVAGCDSTIVLNLTINRNHPATLTETACETFQLNAISYDSSGIYTQLLTTAGGCDSLLTLNLTIHKNSDSTISKTVCDSYTLNSITYDSSGVYTQLLTNAIGCDSILTLNLVVNNSAAYLFTQTACDNFTFNNLTYDSSGVYTQQYTSSNGCDSTIILNLSINKSHPATRIETACELFMLNSISYDSSGIYSQQLTTVGGCDSLITLILTITKNSESTITESACDLFTWNGSVYDSSGTYSQSLINAAGCDSIVTMYLSINKSSSTDFTKTACDTFTFRGQTYNSSGTYSSILTNAIGCDSVLTLHLTINQSSVLNTSQTACKNYFVNGNNYTSSGIYTFPYTNAAGCASTWHLNLTIVTPDTSVSQNGAILTSNQAAASYQWLDCNNSNTPIAGATSQIFTAPVNGNYAVLVNKNTCSDTSDCYAVIGLEINEQNLNEVFSLYPNPATQFIKLHVNPKWQLSTIRLLNPLGQVLQQKERLSSIDFTFDISDFANGIYYFELVAPTGAARLKWIKN